MLYCSFYYVKRVDNNTYHYQKSYGVTNVGTMPDTMGRTSSLSTKTLEQVEEIDKDLQRRRQIDQ